MAEHEAECPVCGSPLTVSVFPHIGGSVAENVSITPRLSEAELTAQALAAAQADAQLKLERANVAAKAAAEAVIQADKDRQERKAAAEKALAERVTAAKATLKVAKGTK